MVSRLVLGCGSVGHDMVKRLSRTGSITVLTPDDGRVDTLRDREVRAVEGDPADPNAYPETADVVLVAGGEVAINLAAARQAREAFPDALLVAYTGPDPTPDQVETFRRVADRVVDPVTSLAERVVDAAAGPASQRARDLRAVLTDLDGPLAVVCHDNPDPDAIASALALATLAESVGVPADPCYYGEISHQENRALVNLLDIDLVHLAEDDRGIEDYAGVALVDHSRSGVNDSLPEDTHVDIVIDHHPPRGPVDAEFVDLRSDVGATSTLLCEYLDRFDQIPSQQVATALLYGIRIDTRDFTREAVEKDFDAAASLLDHVDSTVLERVETPSESAETMAVLARAIRNREVRDGALATGVGEIHDRDALAQAAERLLDMEDVYLTLVYGFMDGTVYASGRTRGGDVDLGETFRDAFGQIGSAGGHADMAGAQIPMGILSDVDEESTETLAAVVEDVVGDRFFEALSDAPRAPVAEEGFVYEYAAEDRTSVVENVTDSAAGTGSRSASAVEANERQVPLDRVGTDGQPPRHDVRGPEADTETDGSGDGTGSGTEGDESDGTGDESDQASASTDRQ